ncbi:unnamed protein product [Zymoseptoria tritici ST99CH_1E4]|uniref:BTB domain-containing protein n=1 Tax=Zymoseptoria tritici ST99CH_1E4 TaxID=1276532 RepID=A0A2H1H8F3_ZYMTR|nr:unnamed protein product [Zymoseptoria tritici ST99CH_1E4]
MAPTKPPKPKEPTSDRVLRSAPRKEAVATSKKPTTPKNVASPEKVTDKKQLEPRKLAALNAAFRADPGGPQAKKTDPIEDTTESTSLRGPATGRGLDCGGTSLREAANTAVTVPQPVTATQAFQRPADEAPSERSVLVTEESSADLAIPSVPDKLHAIEAEVHGAGTIQPPEQPVKKSVYANTIDVLVGADGQHFVVHENYICRKSAFFKAACSKKWVEGRDRVVRLPEILPQTFRVYLDWTYTDRFSLQAVKSSLGTGCFKDHGVECTRENCLVRARLLQFERCYIAAKYLMDDPLHVVVIDGMREWMITKNQERFADQVIELAWSETERGCGLQRVVLDGYLAKIEAADVRGVLEAKFPEFVVDLAARLVELRRNGFTEVSQYTVDKCYYHDHQGSKCT